MAKNLLLNVLVDVLGKFVDGLSVDNLKVGVFSGKISLLNLKLKPSALEDVNLPVTITNGSLKKLILRIPWTHLESKPVVVEMDGLLLQVGPFDLMKTTPDGLRKVLLEAKHKALENVDEMILRNVVLADKQAEKNYMQKLVIKIIDNIEIKISNIHVRYEDISRVTSVPYSAGFTLESITVATTDNNWMEKFVTRDMALGKKDTIHKLGNVKNFTVYWNPKVDPWEYLGIEDWEDKMMQHIYKVAPPLSGSSKRTAEAVPTASELLNTMSERMNYIVKPPNELTVKIVHCEQPEEGSGIPQIDVDVSSTYVKCNVDKIQFKQMMALATTFELLEYRKQMAKYRPSESPLVCPKEWWIYAVKMVSGRTDSAADKVNFCKIDEVLCVAGFHIFCYFSYCR